MNDEALDSSGNQQESSATSTPMEVYHTVAALRQCLNAERAQGRSIAFVPTMGNLHEGHLQLVRLARQHCDVVVVSIFVNPLQFGLSEDWEQYPRTTEDDIKKLESETCDYLFHPDEKEIYPNGMADQARVVVPTMTDIHCGASRPGHFEGVTTVVSKLFNIVQPDKAIFGIKDFQQLAVIRRMVEDLCVPIEVIGAEIARDYDGLALSSRNSFLAPDERLKVHRLYEVLCWCRDQINGQGDEQSGEVGRRDFAAIEASAAEQIEITGFRLDYLSICNARNLEPAAHDDKEIVILGAMYTTGARLIDNVSLVISSPEN